MPTSVLFRTTPHTVTGRKAPVMSCEFGLRGFASACVPQKPGVRHTTGCVVLVVLLDVDDDVLLEVDDEVLLDVVDEVLLELLEVLELVELLVLLDVLELVELLVLLDVELLVLLDVLVVVVETPVPSCFSERKGWSSGASCRRPSFRLSTPPD